MLSVRRNLQRLPASLLLDQPAPLGVRKHSPGGFECEALPRPRLRYRP